MSDYIDTREGWRYIGKEQIPDGAESIVHATGPGTWESWVRGEPVPPLPDVAYTVIRVHWKDGSTPQEYALIQDRWGAMTPPELAPQVYRYEVIAEPRAVTAKAVTDTLKDRLMKRVPLNFELMPDGTEDLESAAFVAGIQDALGAVGTVAREFGVES